MNHRHTVSTTLPMLLAGLIFPAILHANWLFSPSIGAGFEYDDNPILVTGSQTDSSVNGYQAELGAEIVFSSPTSEFVARPRALLKRYSDLSELNSDEYFLNSIYRYTGQRSDFRLRVNFGDESTRTAETANVDLGVDNPGDIPIDSSGQVIGLSNRQRLEIAPTWSYRTTQRLTIRVGGRYIDVNYDKSLLTSYTDYSELTGNFATAFNWSQRSALVLQAYLRENTFEDENLSGHGATLGLEHSLSENTRLILNAGVDSSEDALGQNNENIIGELSLVKDIERSKFLVSYQRAVTGSGEGVLSLRDSVSLNFTYKMSQKMTLGTGIRAYRENGLDDKVTTVTKRDYVQLRGLLSYRVSRTFSIDFDYRYSYIDRKNILANADSNRVNVWLRYGR